MYLTRTAFNSVQLDPCRQLLSTKPSFKIQSSLSHLKNLIVYLRYLTAKWQAQIASNPRTSFLSMWCRLNLEFPFHDSTPRVRDLAWSAILKKIETAQNDRKSVNRGLLNWNLPEPELSIRGAGQEDRSSGNENALSTNPHAYSHNPWSIDKVTQNINVFFINFLH